MLRLMATLFFLGFLGVLAGCATLTEEACEGGDWYSIGHRDGTNGRSVSYFDGHVKSCGKHGIVPDRDDWMRGRELGLREYCTPLNAYQIGRNGRRPNAVCTQDEAFLMSEPNRVGLLYHELTQDIGRLESDLRQVEALIAKTPPDDPAYTHLLRERRELRSDIRRLEFRRSRYASWP